MNRLLDKISIGEPTCYINLNRADLIMWNFLSVSTPVTNTSLLFRAAARPHFNYLFPYIDRLGMSSEEELNLIDDTLFSEQIRGVDQNTYIQHAKFLQELRVLLSSDRSRKIVLISTSKDAGLAGVRFHKVVNIHNADLFGNVEPVWKTIREQLDGTADIYLLSMGLEKFLIGPRLKMLYQKPVLDVQLSSGLKVSYKAFAASVLRKLRRTFKV